MKWLRVRLASGGEALIAASRICAVLPGKPTDDHRPGAVLMLERSDSVAIEGSIGAIEAQIVGIVPEAR